MLGEFLTATLTLLFGYAYPAFECFKMVERRPGQLDQLKFWCQYWLPMYGEAKLAFFVYLWYPKTKGSDLVYETFLRPFVMQYEPNMEERLANLRSRSGQILVFYIKNFTDKGTVFFLELLHQVVSPTPIRERLRHEEKNDPGSGWSPFPVKRPVYKEPRTRNDSDIEIDEAIAKPPRRTAAAAATARGKYKRPHYLTNSRR